MAPGPRRSFGNLEFDQFDGFVIEPQFQDWANNIKIRPVILVDRKDRAVGICVYWVRSLNSFNCTSGTAIAAYDQNSHGKRVYTGWVSPRTLICARCARRLLCRNPKLNVFILSKGGKCYSLQILKVWCCKS